VEGGRLHRNTGQIERETALPVPVQNLFFLFPVFFVALWLAITVALSYFSGWTALVKAFPDRDETPSLRLSG
jgi:hypothetical protein